MTKGKNVNHSVDGIKEAIIPLLKQKFFSRGIKDVKVSFYKSMIQPPIRPFGGLTIDLEEGLILFFETDLKYPQGGGFFPAATEHNNMPAVSLELGKYFTNIKALKYVT